MWSNMPNPNPELRLRITALSDGRRTAQEIADLVGRSRAHVQDLVRAMNLPRPGRGTGKPRQRSAESLATIARIEQLADGATSSHEIACAVGATAKYVQRILLEKNLPRLPQSGPTGHRNSSFSGGRSIDHDGYATVPAPAGHPHARILRGRTLGRIAEHRLVVEQKLGRHLLPGEVVDHVDGLHLHNHPDNLRVFPSNGDHLRATISEKIPRWSAEGRVKLFLSNRRVQGLPVVDTYRTERARGDVRLRQILLAWLSLEEGSPFLLGTHRWLARAGILDLSRSSLERHLQRVSQRSQQGHAE